MKDALGRKVELRRDDKKKFGVRLREKVIFFLTANWIFSSLVEKIILVAMMGWTIYSILKYIS